MKINEAGFKGRFKSSQTGGSFGKQGNIQIGFAKAESATSALTGKPKEYIAIYLSHIWKDHKEELVKVINGSGIPRAVMDCYLTPNEQVILRINKKASDAVQQFLPNLNAAIKSLGQYSDASVDTLCDNLVDVIDSVATEEDIETSNANISNNWKEMLQRLDDPDVRKRLLMYQATGNFSKDFGLGWVLSPSNMQSVLSQMPKASFVVERSTWKKIFNRSIAPNATRIVILKPNTGSGPSIQQLNDAAVKSGFSSFADAKKRTNNSTQVMSAIRKLAQRGVKNFIPVVVYDVSDTIPPTNQNDDVWTNEIGLSNNLTGFVNTKAEDFLRKNGQDIPKVETDDTTDVNVVFPEERKIVEYYCKKNNVDTNRFDGYRDSDFIVAGVSAIAEKKAPEFGFIYPGTVKKIASLAAIVICDMCKITQKSLSQTKLYGNYKDVGNDEAMAIYTITKPIMGTLLKHVREKSKRFEGKQRKSINLIFEKRNSKMKVNEFLKGMADHYGYKSTFANDASGDGVDEMKRIINESVSKTIRKFVNNKTKKRL